MEQAKEQIKATSPEEVGGNTNQSDQETSRKLAEYSQTRPAQSRPKKEVDSWARACADDVILSPWVGALPYD